MSRWGNKVFPELEIEEMCPSKLRHYEETGEEDDSARCLHLRACSHVFAVEAACKCQASFSGLAQSAATDCLRDMRHAADCCRKVHIAAEATEEKGRHKRLSRSMVF